MRLRLDRLLANGTDIIKSLSDRKNLTTRLTLLDAGNVDPIIRRLNKEAEYQFPFAERLSDFVITAARFSKLENKAFIELSFPIVENESYVFYKVNTPLVTQRLSNKIVGIANIRPRDDYVITECRKQHYKDSRRNR